MLIGLRHVVEQLRRLNSRYNVITRAKTDKARTMISLYERLKAEGFNDMFA